MTVKRPELLLCEVTEPVLRAFFGTFNILGHGFLEVVYRRALAQELRSAGLRVQEETPVQVFFKGTVVGHYRLDLLVENALAVELKASAILAATDRRQLLNYLRASELDVGLLLHFGEKPAFHRLVSPRVLQRQRVYPVVSG